MPCPLYCKQCRDDWVCMGGCMQVLCKYCTIRYKGLEPLRALICSGVPGATVPLIPRDYCVGINAPNSFTGIAVFCKCRRTGLGKNWTGQVKGHSSIWQRQPQAPPNSLSRLCGCLFWVSVSTARGSGRQADSFLTTQGLCCAAAFMEARATLSNCLEKSSAPSSVTSHVPTLTQMLRLQSLLCSLGENFPVHYQHSR